LVQNPVGRLIITRAKFIIKMSKHQNMDFRFIPFTATVILVIASIYVLTSPTQVLVEARKTVIDITCHSQGNGKTRCCGDEADEKMVSGLTGVVYCTTCDDTNPPSHCTPREKIDKGSILGLVKPGSDVLNALKGSKGLDVKSPSTTTDITKLPKNFTSKSGELLKGGASIESENNPPPTNSNGTLQ
jgi:hypothetical protein